MFGDHGPPQRRKTLPVPKTKLSSGVTKKLGICLANCKYEILGQVAKSLNFTQVESEEAPWDLYWSDLSVSSERVARMAAFQRINHFPGMMEICRKASLVRNLKRMREKFPQDYNFFPNSWSLPDEVDELRIAMRRTSTTRAGRTEAGPSKLMPYIIKPDAGAMGRGIYLVNKEEDLDLTVGEFNGWVAQEYINRPLLIDGYKFDLRIYVLVTSVDPLRVYMYDEGLARFATAKYEDANSTNLSTRNMHLTNYSVNKHCKEFIKSEDEDDGSKRTLSAVMRLLAEQGHDVEALRQNIADILVKTLLSVSPHLASTFNAATSRTRMQKGAKGVGVASCCFELLGFDVLIDADLKTWVLEVNHSPSFNCDSHLDQELKKVLLTDTIKSLGLSTKRRQRFLAQQRKQQRKRLYGSARAAPAEAPSWLPLRQQSSALHRPLSPYSAFSNRPLRNTRRDRRLLMGDVENEPAAESSSSSSSEDEGEALRPPSRIGGFRCIYPEGSESRLAPFLSASLADFG